MRSAVASSSASRITIAGGRARNSNAGFSTIWTGSVTGRTSTPLIRSAPGRAPVVRAIVKRCTLKAVDALARQGLVYGCACSRRSLEQAADGAAERRYSGYCRSRNLPLGPGIGWRLRLDPGSETFSDARLGTQHQDPASQCGDLLLRDKSGNWTYQFAAAVDDYDQGVDLVVRGIDLLASTGRQLRVARRLGRTTPAVYLHHPLIMKSSDQKLSKSDGDSGVRDLRARGWTPDQVRAAAIAAVTGTR